MTLRYTTVRNFLEEIGLNKDIMTFLPDQNPQREVVAESPAAISYYLRQLGVNPETLFLYKGTTNDSLTVTTHYTFDSDRSKVTLTSAGVTFLDGSQLTAEYEYCELGRNLKYNQIVSILEKSEQWVESQTNTVFANQTAASPQYTQVVDERMQGQGYIDNRYTLSYYPLVRLETTVASSYTSGNTTLSLTDATGFPSSGTIYVDGNKVSYTARSSNNLTIPASTPDLTEGGVVRGEVIEVSSDGSGTGPSFVVLRPDIDYAIDYDTGDIVFQTSDLTGFFRLESARPYDGVDNRVRISYMSAWHEPNKQCVIPSEIIAAVHLKAGLFLLNMTMLRANVNLRENFNASNFNVTREELDEMLNPYKVTLIGKA